MSTIVRHYDSTKNLDGGTLPGVPLDDITEEQFSSYPEWLQRSIDAHPMYRKSAPRETPKPAIKAEKE